MEKYEHQSWPAWYYGSEGQSEIFNNAEEVPEDWSDDPKAFDDVEDDVEETSKRQGKTGKKAAADDDGDDGDDGYEVPAYDDITEKQIKAKLDELEIDYASGDNKTTVYELLTDHYDDEEE